MAWPVRASSLDTSEGCILMGVMSSALFMGVEVSPGTGCVPTRESGVIGDAGSCQGTTGEANLTRVVTSSVSIDPHLSQSSFQWGGRVQKHGLLWDPLWETAVGKMG